MSFAHIVRDLAERMGLEVSSASKASVRHWRDLGKITPLNDVRVVFDVGAHHGETAIQYAQKMPRAAVYSFEPDPRNFRVAQAACRGHSRITCVPAALAHESGELPFYLGAGSQEGSLSPHARTTDAVEMVTVSTVDDVARERRLSKIDLLKIDTEGHELDVLCGATGMLDAHAIDFVFAEVTFDASDTQHTSFRALCDALEPRDYRVLGIYDVMLHDAPWRVWYANALFTCV